jgi:hypothetical protein
MVGCHFAARLQKLLGRLWVSLGGREGINRKAGRRGESAFLFLGDQNQKYSSWKRAEAGEPNRL